MSVKDDHGLDHHLRGGGEDGKSIRESQYILKEEPMMFADRMDVGHVRVEGDQAFWPEQLGG